MGNRANVVDGGISTTYVPDDVNRCTSVGTNNVSSGPDHQIGGYQGNTYNYVGDSYLTSISGPASYAVGYDALGPCVKRTLNGVTTYYVYDGEKPILEYASTGAITGKNIYGRAIDEILMRTDYVVNPSGVTYYYQDDKEGSVTQLTNGSGAIIESYRYDVFGAPTIKDGNGNVISTTAYNNRFLFTGREYVSTFGIYEYRARTYHPGLGRFLSEDPKGFDAGDYNLFRYCMNDPEDHTDPTGLMMATSIGMMAGCPVSDGMGGTDTGKAIDILKGLRNMEHPPAWAFGWTSEAQKSEGFLARLFHSIFGRHDRSIRSKDTDDSAIAIAAKLPIDKNYKDSGGPVPKHSAYITHYGPGVDFGGWDDTHDTNTNNGFGNHGNKLTPHSLAVADDIAQQNGLRLGGRVFINHRYLGNYDDTPGRSGTIDVYDRYNAVKQVHWGGLLRNAIISPEP